MKVKINCIVWAGFNDDDVKKEVIKHSCDFPIRTVIQAAKNAYACTIDGVLDRVNHTAYVSKVKVNAPWL